MYVDIAMNGGVCRAVSKKIHLVGSVVKLSTTEANFSLGSHKDTSTEGKATSVTMNRYIAKLII
jgi:hypothetical protein